VFTLGEVVHLAPALRPAEAALRRRQMPHRSPLPTQSLAGRPPFSSRSYRRS
jgi:hypothetical protein